MQRIEQSTQPPWQIAAITFPASAASLTNCIIAGQRRLHRHDLAVEKPSILLFHTPTNADQMGNNKVEQHFSTYWRPDTSCSLSKALGIDLQLSGHTHAGQFFPFTLATRLIYGGRDRGLHTDGVFNLYTSRGTGTWGPPLRTGGPGEITVITLARAN